MVGVRLLGAVGADVDGTPLGLGPPRQRGVLAWLALVHPRPSSVDTIIAALWGDDCPSSARNAVQVYISGLRKILRGHNVDLDRVGDGYALRGSALDVDVTAFDGLVAKGRAFQCWTVAFGSRLTTGWTWEGGKKLAWHPRSVVIRTGPTLVLYLAGDAPVLLSVDQASEAADVVNALLLRREAQPGVGIAHRQVSAMRDLTPGD